MDVDLDHLRELGPSDDHDQFLNEWRRFQRAQERRRAYFLSENQQIVKTTSRLFIISHNEDPWHCFGLTSRIDYCRRVFELSGLHFSELHDACASGDCDRIQEILESDDGDDSQGCTLSRDCCGRIPLHHAVSREHHRAIQLLLAQKDRRLQLHVRDNRGATPVQCVLEKMRCLALNLGFKPAERAKQLRETNPRYRTLWRLADEMLASMNASFVEEIRAVDCLVRGDVWDAVRFGDVERLKQIRTLYGDFGDVRLDGLGTTLLHEACCVSPRDLNVVLYLISELRVDRHVADQSGCTTLHLAAMRGWLEACVLLLTDIEDDGLGGTTEQFLLATDARGRTPLHAALGFAGRGRRANDDLCGDTAAEAVATARYLLQLCPDALHVIDSDGFTPFHYAICTGDVQLVQLMIDLGADVLGALEQGEVPPTSVYGQKATWAPCGTVFSRKRRKAYSRENTVNPGRTEFAPVEEVVDASRLSTDADANFCVLSKACERLQKVKAGLVEHPGTTLPMETLWFWVHKKHASLCRSPAASTFVDATASKPPIFTEPPGDAQSYGCRRFGAVCPACINVPGEPSERVVDTRRLRVESALQLAVRCCRRKNQTPVNRVTIVETLLQAGASPDETLIDEALRVVTSPQVLQLLLRYSSNATSSELVLKHFCSGWEVAHDLECRESMLLAVFDEIGADNLNQAMPALFRHRYFKAVDWVLARKRSMEVELSSIIRAMQRVQEPRKTLRLHAKLAEDHLAWTMHVMDSCPSVDVAEFSGLAMACISEMLASTSYYSARTRHAADTAIVSALSALFNLLGNAKLSEVVVEWALLAIDRGLIATVQRLWPWIVAEPKLAEAFVHQSMWPLRSADATFASVFASLASSLVDAVMSGVVQWNESSAVLLSRCLGIVCTSCSNLQSVRQIIACITQADCADRVVDVMLSLRFDGDTVIDHIVKRDDVELAEILWKDLKLTEETRERLWIALTRARVRLKSIQIPHGERWQQLLFHSTPVMNEETQRCFVLKTLVRMPQHCEITKTLLLPLVSKGLTGEYLHEVARWNAFDLAQQWIGTYANTKAQWSQLVMQRHDASGFYPIDVCEMLGHHRLARLLRALVVEAGVANPVSPLGHRRYGLLRSLMSLPGSDSARSSTFVSSWRSNFDPTQMLSGRWSTAVAWDDLRMLQAFLLHDVPLTDDACEDDLTPVENLVQLAVKCGSYNALEWLLLQFPAKISQLSAETTASLVHKAASHSSSLYARLTQILLRHPGIFPGRLSGDGTDTSLLHRVACFSDSNLAVETLQMLLTLDGSDVNVRDGFGSTPVMYALAAGRLETACWLMSQCQATRLEAEYEGQSLFYYSLHLLPSFAWRYVVQQLLTATRQAAFLHCQGDDCACKGFEGGDQQSCSFCGHSVAAHTRVPYPPWFRDQYESYVQPLSEGDSEAVDQEDNDDEDEEALILRRQRALMETPLIDEATLEKGRGRLRGHALLSVTQLRFQSLLLQYNLCVPSVDDRDVTSDEREETEDIHDNIHPLETTKPTDDRANLTGLDGESPSVQEPLQGPLRSLPRTARKPLLPRFLHGDAAMVSVHQSCCSLDWHDTTTRGAQTQIVLANWFRACCSLRQDRTPAVDFVLSDRDSSLRKAFMQWRDVTMSDQDTGNDLVPLSSGTQLKTPVAERRTTSTAVSDAVRDLIGSSGGSPTIANPTHQPQRVSILQLFVHHWQYARVYQSFRHWKRLMVNAQVAHHELETLGDTWSAAERRVKLQSLVARQQALEKEIGALGLIGDASEV